MALAFDHLMIGVADLDAASARWRTLGFEVRPGGEHDGLGTANAIVPFARRGYVELIGIRDAATTRAAMRDGERFVELVQAHQEIPLIFVLRADDLGAAQSALAGAGLAVGPIDASVARLTRRAGRHLLAARAG